MTRVLSYYFHLPKTVVRLVNSELQYSVNKQVKQQMSVNIVSRATLNEAVHSSLQRAIRQVLIQYHGRYEESLVGWFLALRLTVPGMAHPWQLTEVFRHLLDAGIIELQKPGVGPYSGDDEAFFNGTPFTAILTAVARRNARVTNRQ